MKKLIIIILTSLILMGCSVEKITDTPMAISTITEIPVSSPIETQTPTTSPTETPVPASTKEPTATLTKLPSLTPTAEKELIWSNDFGEPIMLDYLAGGWSPTENEMLLYRCYEGTLMKVAAPEFTPVELSPYPIICPYMYGEMIWSPDGQQIYFNGPLSEDAELSTTQENSTTWVVNRDGSDLHFASLTPRRWLRYYGWLNNCILIEWSYAGGGHQFVEMYDTTTNTYQGSVFFYGETFSLSSQYVAANTGDPQPNVFAISYLEQGQEFDLVDSDYVLSLPTYDPGETYQIRTYFVDWLPGTNRMLVEKIEQVDNGSFATDLLLWNVDTSIIEPLVSDGIGGQFSPNGELLAYVTKGAVKLDAAGKPLVSETTEGAPYIQLFDLESGTVLLSLPVELTQSAIFAGQNLAEITFSPDGRYFSLITPAEIVGNSIDWPLLIDGASGEENYLHVIDLEEKQVILSEKTKQLPSWSPLSDKFIYHDESGNLILFDLSDAATASITESVGQNSLWSSWSFDGSYIAIGIQDTENHITRTGFLQLP